jgi:hypothetical protein
MFILSVTDFIGGKTTMETGNDPPLTKRLSRVSTSIVVSQSV